MIIIREEREADRAAVEALTFAAFETMDKSIRQETTEHILAGYLRDDPDFVPRLDLVATQNGEIVGNIMYSVCAVIRPDGSEAKALTFGPLSVKPQLFGRGIGGRLVEESLKIAKEMGFGGVVIMGHPEYYCRFGFEWAGKFNLVTEDGKCPKAFMALELEEGFFGDEGGTWRLCRAFKNI